LQSELQQDSQTSQQQILSTAHLHVLPFGLEHSAHCRGQTDPIQGWYAPEFGKRFANDVWSFSANTAPPLWCGFVLWPEANPCALQQTTNADSCQLSIAADKQYDVTINDEGVSLQ